MTQQEKSNSNYIDAYYNRKKSEVIVWERADDGRRLIKRYPAPFYFYVKDPNGSYLSMYGDKLKRLDFRTKAEFDAALHQYPLRFESDIDPMQKVLQTHYYNKPKPNLNYAFVDIEWDYDSSRSYGGTMDPYARIHAVTVWQSWSSKFHTVVIRPPEWQKNNWGMEKFPDDLKEETHITLVNDEKTLLTLFLDLIQEADLWSGWNSDFADFPYLALRIQMTLGNELLKKFSFDFAPEIRFEEMENYGEITKIAKWNGRVHIDYMQLFKKFNAGGRASYALGNVAEEELDDVQKLKYDGTLETLYHDDFVHFTRYNLFDVKVLVEFEKKFKYVNIANTIAHNNTVPIPKVLGTVAGTDSAIINYSHYKRNRIVNDKIERPYITIEGGLVLIPKRGLHEWIGSCDINSLYPSAMRSLNISPEKMIGQFVNDFVDWKEIRARSSKEITLVIESSKEEITLPAKEWPDILKAAQWAVSAFGTVFDQGNGIGIIPGLLAEWYAERKRLQAEKLKAADKADELKKNGASEKEIKEYLTLEELFDTEQMAFKLSLNSLYGAVINQFCKFFDHRLGASTTGTGRQITSHMVSYAGELINGNNDETIRHEEFNKKGELEISYTNDNKAVIYSDTDSVYFLTNGKNKEESISNADRIGNEINKSFPNFMREAFFVEPGFDELIKAGREVVARRGIFIVKKKYILNVINLDGKDVPPGSKKSTKAMGSEIKKSDTPKVIQKFLKNVTTEILANGASYKDIEKYILEFRDDFKSETDILDIGVSKSCNNMVDYTNKYLNIELAGGKVTIPGHIRAAINYNEFIKSINDKVSPTITSANKIKTYYLKKNRYGFKSIAFPSDIDKLPQWFFDNFKVDIDIMEEKLIDLKVKNIFDAINWIVPTKQTAFENEIFEF